jgi:hypothetical protein
MMKFSPRIYLFSIQHSFKAHGNPVVIELQTAKELAKHL